MQMASRPAFFANRRRNWFDKVIPPPSHDERRRGDELAIADALAHGVTSVQDFSDWEDFLVFEELEKEGKLNLRISEWLPFKDPLAELEKDARPSRPQRSDASYRNAERLHGWFAWLANRGDESSVFRRPDNTGLPQYTRIN